MRTALAVLCPALSVAFALLAAPPARAQAETPQEVIFRDDFTGTSLHPSWSVKGQDPDRWALTESEYLIVITKPWEEGGGAPNAFVYTGQLPDDYEMNARFVARLNKFECCPPGGNVIFIGVERDQENRVYLQVGGDGKIRFDSVLKGDVSRLEREVGELPEEVFLKLVKRGVEFEGSFSFDGATWSSMGKQFFINLNGKPVLGGYNSVKEVADTGVRIDFVEITAP